MKIILNQDVANLGEEGDIKVVADGYARNYLIPQKLAVPCTKGNMDLFEQKKKNIESRKEEKRKSALGLKEKIEAEEVAIIVPVGDNGKLFGSVTSATIVEELEKSGIRVDRKKVEVPGHTIKVIGDYTILIKLYGTEEAKLKVSVKAAEAAE